MRTRKKIEANSDATLLTPPLPLSVGGAWLSAGAPDLLHPTYDEVFMTRIVDDKNGSYDLAYVVAISRVPWESPGPGGTRVKGGDFAKLHYKGQSFATQLEYGPVRDMWLKIKASEGHPVDSVTEGRLS